MYTVTLPNKFHGERYGILFINGEGKTDSKWIASHLKSKGIDVSEGDSNPVTPPQDPPQNDIPENTGNTQPPQDPPQNDIPTLESLKAEADALGVKYSPNIGEKKLKQRIEDFKNA